MEPSKEESAKGMGQSPLSKHAAMKDAPTFQKMEESALGTALRSKHAIMTDAPTMPKRKGSVGSMEPRKAQNGAVVRDAPTYP